MLDMGGVSAEDMATHRKRILWALDDLRLVHITCLGGDVHLLQPHAIVRKADGTELLEAYQVEGDHDGRTESGWRHFDIATITALEVRSGKFTARRDFRPVSGESGVVVAQVRGSAPAQP